MPEINDIKIRSLDIAPIPDWSTYPSSAIPYSPPVTVNIGVPIVEIPGCVEAHESNSKSKSLSKDDERGLATYCDAGIPSYSPINFEPNQIVPTVPAGVDTRQKEKPKPPGQVELPQPAPPATAKVDCPTPAQQTKEPIGTYVEGFRKKVTEYKLIGNECVQITEAVPLPQQIVAGLPSGGMVMQTGSIAVIATTSALMAKPLADILLKVVRPTIKKVMKKIAKIRGKKIKVLSVKERQDQQRSYSHALNALKGKR